MLEYKQKQTVYNNQECLRLLGTFAEAPRNILVLALLRERHGVLHLVFEAPG